VLEKWARAWYLWVSATFLKSYLQFTADIPILPQGREGVKVILDAYLLDKAMYEVNYELNNRPDWLGLPLQGILQMLEAEAEPVETVAQAAREPEETAKEARGKAEQKTEK
jgi:maltose alpha-D-glucosyltransferase/alpha-amylase